MISTDTPLGTEVWSCDWRKAWKGKLFAIGNRSACVGDLDNMHVKPLEEFFPDEMDAIMTLIEKNDDNLLGLSQHGNALRKRLIEITKP